MANSYKDLRPDPDKLLAKLKAQELKSTKGKFKIFLGFAAGVGKTYSMLQAAHRLLNDNIDVVAGCVVTHGRVETEALLNGLPQIPLKSVEYRGTNFKEFDIDAAIAKHPNYILLDELAHTNVTGSRHEKRYQDAEELLNAGISVFATLNIQHIESNSDIISQITKTPVRETVPDYILEKADEIELIDITPEELIERLHEGKVYLSEELSKKAQENFFRMGNLIALRELSLRIAAETIDLQMQRYRQDQEIQSIWPVSEKFAVCISASPLSPRLVRATKRMAISSHAEWYAVYVETTEHLRLTEREKTRLFKTVSLAENLGAQVITLGATSVAQELIAFAKAHNITRIIIGKSTGGTLNRLKDMLFGSLIDHTIRLSGDIDVYVITGDPLPGEITPHYGVPVQTQKQTEQYFYAIGIVVLASIINYFAFTKLKQVNLIMIYLLAIIFAATKFGPGPSALASILSVVCYDFFFVPPYMSFAVSDIQYLFTLFVMLVVALTVSTMTVRNRQQAELAKQRERQTAALYAMTKEQVTATNKESILAASVKHLNEVFDSKIAVLLPNDIGSLDIANSAINSYVIDSHEMGVAQWAFTKGQVAGFGTNTLPGAKAIYLPLDTPHGTLGVIGLLPSQHERLLNPEEMNFLKTFVSQIALALASVSNLEFNSAL